MDQLFISGGQLVDANGNAYVFLDANGGELGVAVSTAGPVPNPAAQPTDADLSAPIVLGIDTAVEPVVVRDDSVPEETLRIEAQRAENEGQKGYIADERLDDAAGTPVLDGEPINPVGDDINLDAPDEAPETDAVVTDEAPESDRVFEEITGETPAVFDDPDAVIGESASAPVVIDPVV